MINFTKLSSATLHAKYNLCTAELLTTFNKNYRTRILKFPFYLNTRGEMNKILLVSTKKMHFNCKKCKMIDSIFMAMNLKNNVFTGR